MYFTCLIRKKFLITFSCILIAVIFMSGAYSISQAAFLNKSNEGVRVPIIMYHSILNDSKALGTYVISPDVFQKDMLYLKEKGYNSIFISDLIDFVYNEKPLPENPVIITLDDGYLNNFTNVLPILEKTDTKATISIIGIHSESYTNKPDRHESYAHMTWDDINALISSNRVEIGNHTYNMHTNNGRKGSLKKSGESVTQYEEIFKNDVGKLQELLKANCNYSPNIFTYPFGFISEEALPVLKNMGFKAALTCRERVNYISSDPECLYHLGRFNRPNGISTESFMKKIIEE